MKVYEKDLYHKVGTLPDPALSIQHRMGICEGSKAKEVA